MDSVDHASPQPKLLQAVEAFANTFQDSLDSFTVDQMGRFQTKFEYLLARDSLAELQSEARFQLKTVLEPRPIKMGKRRPKDCWKNMNSLKNATLRIQRVLSEEQENLEEAHFEAIKAHLKRCLTQLERERSDRKTLSIVREVAQVNPVIGYSEAGRRRSARHKHNDKRDASHRGRVHRNNKSRRKRK